MVILKKNKDSIIELFYGNILLYNFITFGYQKYIFCSPFLQTVFIKNNLLLNLNLILYYFFKNKFFIETNFNNINTMRQTTYVNGIKI